MLTFLVYTPTFCLHLLFFAFLPFLRIFWKIRPFTVYSLRVHAFFCINFEIEHAKKGRGCRTYTVGITSMVFQVIHMLYLTGTTKEIMLNYIQRQVPPGVGIEVKSAKLAPLPSMLQVFVLQIQGGPISHSFWPKFLELLLIGPPIKITYFSQVLLIRGVSYSPPLYFYYFF